MEISENQVKTLPMKIKISYALGQLGWSILSGIIQVWLVWFYNPPKTVQIPELIPRNAVLGFLTVIGLITMLGRFVDAIKDTWIASLSAIFGILPNAIVADIAKNDGDRTGEYKEGMFFAVQTFMNKMGQMIAMVSFSSILLLGKERGADLGIRMTGIAAAIIGIIALLIFTKYQDE